MNRKIKNTLTYFISCVNYGKHVHKKSSLSLLKYQMKWLSNTKKMRNYLVDDDDALKNLEK